jgi:hypothetical protein
MTFLTITMRQEMQTMKQAVLTQNHDHTCRNDLQITLCSSVNCTRVFVLSFAIVVQQWPSDVMLRPLHQFHMVPKQNQGCHPYQQQVAS